MTHYAGVTVLVDGLVHKCEVVVARVKKGILHVGRLTNDSASKLEGHCEARELVFIGHRRPGYNFLATPEVSVLVSDGGVTLCSRGTLICALHHVIVSVESFHEGAIVADRTFTADVHRSG